MRRAILVMATTVAFLVSGAAYAVTGSRTSTISSAADLIKNGTFADSSGNLKIQSAPVSGTYIPAGASASTEVAVATRTAGTIAKSAVSTAVKAAVRANGAVIAVNGAIAAATAAVDWIQKDGSYVKRSSGQTKPDVKWLFDGSPTEFSTPSGACDGFQASQLIYDGSWTVVGLSQSDSVSYRCTISNSSGNTAGRSIYQSLSCKSPTYYDSTAGICVGGQAGYSSLSEQDYNDLGDWVQQQDGTYVRQAAIESCSLAINPEACFQTVVPDRQITGPATVLGNPVTTSKTVTTTQPDGSVTTGTTTTTTTPAASVTYNNNTTNNIQYNTYDKITTKNPDGSETSTETNEGTPDVPDWLTPSLKPLQDLPDMIKGQGSEGSSVPYTSWFDLGGGKCSEIVMELPVVGTVRSTFCDMYYKYVHPALYFLFSVWTWHTCFQIFRESATRVRAK